MNNLGLFFNTKIEGTGVFSWVGNAGLSPVRYLFDGQTVRTQYDRKLSIHHVASFHPDGVLNTSKTWHPLRMFPYKEPARSHAAPEVHPFSSSNTSFLKTVLSITLLIPGLFLSVFKLASYLYAENRQINEQVKRHFTPLVRQIGTVENPIKSPDELMTALACEKSAEDKPYHQLTTARVVYDYGALKINSDPVLLSLIPVNHDLFYRG